MKIDKDQHRIVVGVDGSRHSSTALRWALRQAALTGATIEAVVCWQRPALYGEFAAMAFVDADLAGPAGEAARAAVADGIAATAVADRVSVQTRVVEGYPSRVLVNAAAGADLLVVGSRGHGELSGMLLGSVGLHCASHASCPVLIVHDQVDEDNPMSPTASPTHPEPERSPRVRPKDVTVDGTGAPSRAGGGLPALGVDARQPLVVDGLPSPDPRAKVTSENAGGLTDLVDAHQRAVAALDDPGVSSLVAVAWAAGHLAAVARVLYPVAVRTLPYGRGRVHMQLAVDHRLQQDLWRLDRLLTGDTRLAGTSVRDVEDAVRHGLEQHAAGAHRLVVELRAALSPQKQHTLDNQLAAALRDGPTRPHPHTPHEHLAGRRTFWFWGAIDRTRDLLDSRSASTPHPVAVPRRLGRWGAYLMGVPDRPTPGKVAPVNTPARDHTPVVDSPTVRTSVTGAVGGPSTTSAVALTAVTACTPTPDRSASLRYTRSLLVWESEGGHLDSHTQLATRRT